MSEKWRPVVGSSRMRSLLPAESGAPADEELAEFEALGFAAGEGVERLAELEVAEADFDERGEGGDDLVGGACVVGAVDSTVVRVEADGFGDGEVEDVGDGFAVVVDIRGWRICSGGHCSPGR